MNKIPLVAATLLSLSNAYALQDVVKIEDSALAGSGCADGSAALSLETIDADIGILRLDMTEAKAQVRGSRRLQRKSCVAAIPVRVPLGKRLHVLRSIAIGATELKGDAVVRASLEIFTPGSAGNALQSRVEASEEILNQPIIIDAEDVLTTACGEDTTLRINSSLLLTSGTSQHSEANLDTVAMLLSLEDCESW